MYIELENISIQKNKESDLLKSLFLTFFLSYVENIKNEILSKDYDLSISFLDEKTAQKINMQHRQKDYVPNTLSFPYTEKSGEIFLQLETINAQAKDFDLSPENFLLKIYIHSLLHLKGLDHGSKMDKLEDKFLLKYRK